MHWPRPASFALCLKLCGPLGRGCHVRIDAALGNSASPFSIPENEKGANRVGAGRLFDIAHALGMPITHFFEGAKSVVRVRRSSTAASRRA